MDYIGILKSDILYPKYILNLKLKIRHTLIIARYIFRKMLRKYIIDFLLRVCK
ncbi:hypothetical protein BCJMU51_2265 [Bacillus cereus]|nr:hypothetical protein BCM0045_2275 [Bacillus cereus]BCC00201.1 hypothetical protein BCM0057_2283 [Bacillus cereus]BCC23706.1 hypothetical protein BCM0079_2299 [Bacillus cereus]BCC41075.1 hypothetical protein BCJMU01_2242 [Bacillus cereus]BCC70575.1 hypothetical protein BCJMU51_2265 [Bacillus cereus]